MTPSSTTDSPARMPGERAALIWGVVATILVVVSTIGVFLVALHGFATRRMEKGELSRLAGVRL